MGRAGNALLGCSYRMTLNLCSAGHETHESLVVDTAYGPFHIWNWSKYRGFPGYCTGQDDVSMSLDLYGTWERPDIKRTRQILTEKPGTVLDFGAHIGWYGAQAAALGCDVVTVESDPENQRLLRKNIEGYDVIWQPILQWVIDVEALPSWIDEVRFLKSDVEGAEDQVINLTRHLWADRKIDHALLEISPVFKDYYPALVDELASYGYKPYIIKDETDWEITGSDVVFPQENVWFSKRP
jgi:hypothetical protein